MRVPDWKWCGEEGALYNLVNYGIPLKCKVRLSMFAVDNYCSKM